MEWDELYETSEEVTCSVYLAEIVGSDPTYQFARIFQRLKCFYREDGVRCKGMLDDTGVFEERARWYDRSGKLIKDVHNWFVLFEGDYYEIDREDVLHTLFNLRLQK